MATSHQTLTSLCPDLSTILLRGTCIIIVDVTRNSENICRIIFHLSVLILRILHVDVHIVIGNESTADWQTMHNSYLASFYEVNMPKKLQMPGMSVVKETYKVLVWKSYQWTCICVRKLIIHICLCMKADHYNKIALCFCVG